MSRIGKKPVPLGSAKVSVQDHLVKVEGPKGRLEQQVHPLITVKLDAEKKELVVTRPDDQKQSKALHGLTRSLLANMVEGVTNGSVGYANQITLDIPAGVTMTLEGANKIHVAGPSKQLVGQFASDIRRVRKPEPYKGKGIRYEGEVVKIKPGKAFAGAGAK